MNVLCTCFISVVMVGAALASDAFAQQVRSAGPSARTAFQADGAGERGWVQIRRAQEERNPVKKGMLVGAVIGASLLVSYVVLEDMLGGDVLKAENAENGITPQRIVGYTAVGLVVGAAVGGTIGYLKRRKGGNQRRDMASQRHGASLPPLRLSAFPP